MRESSAPADDPPPSGTFPLTVTDDNGRTVTIARPPRRIVSLAPANTEILFALGAQKKLVGVTSYCTFPPEAKELPQVGGYADNSISLERILARKPDLVLAEDKIHKNTMAALQRRGQPVVGLAPRSFAALYRDIELLGRIVDREAQARELVAGMKARVAAVRERAALVPAAQRVRVVFLIWDEPLITATRSSFVGEMIEICGAENVFADLPGAFPPVSEEVLRQKDPDVLLLPSRGMGGTSFDRLLERPALRRLAAVKNRRVHRIPEDLVSRPGPRLAEGLEAVAQALYPQHFPAPGQTAELGQTGGQRPR